MSYSLHCVCGWASTMDVFSPVVECALHTAAMQVMTVNELPIGCLACVNFLALPGFDSAPRVQPLVVLTVFVYCCFYWWVCGCRSQPSCC